MKNLEPSTDRNDIERQLHQKAEVIENKVALVECPAWLTVLVRLSWYLLEAGLGFRRHNESEEYSGHKGNFLELISWVCDYDASAQEVLLNGPMLSSVNLYNLQKDIIKCFGAETRKIILSELGDKYFSVSLEEAGDESLKRKIAVVIRFVNDNGEIVERFLGVVHVVEYSGQGLKDVLDEFFVKNELSLSRLRGLSVGWAPNMREEINELITLIRNENKNVHYIHSFSQELQPTVVSVAEESHHAGLFFDYISLIVDMVTTPCLKHDASGKEYCEELVIKILTGVVSTMSRKNKNIRWGSHFETLIGLFDGWELVEKVLIFIHLKGDLRKDRGKAKDLIERMGTFEFVFIGKLMLFVIGFVDRASKLLQNRDEDIEIALNEVHKLIEVLVIYIEEGWDQLLEGAEAFCEEHKIEVPDMEDLVKCRLVTLVGSDPPSYFDRYRSEIMQQVCFEIFKEVINRFSDESMDLLKCVNCLHPSNSFARYDLDKLVHLAELYPEDFSVVERAELYHQLDAYIEEMRGNPEFSNINDMKTLVKKLVENKFHIYFPLVYRLIELASVLPIASPVFGRKFSAVNFAAIDLHDRFGHEALSDQLLCYIEKSMCARIDEVALLQHVKQVTSSNNIYKDICF